MAVLGLRFCERAFSSFDNNHLNECDMVSYGDFDLHFPNH